MAHFFLGPYVTSIYWFVYWILHSIEFVDIISFAKILMAGETCKSKRRRIAMMMTGVTPPILKFLAKQKNERARVFSPPEIFGLFCMCMDMKIMAIFLTRL